MPVTIKVIVEEARDLPVMDRKTELTDAYVEVRFGKEVFKTKSFHKSLNPKWHESFRIEVRDDASLQNGPIEFRVYDYDVVSSDDSIGVVFLDVSSLLHIPAERHYDDGSKGDLTLSDDGLLLDDDDVHDGLFGAPSSSSGTINGGSDRPGASSSSSGTSSGTGYRADDAAATSLSSESPTIKGWFPIYDTLKGVRGELYLAVQLEGFRNYNPNADSSARVQFFASERVIPAYVHRVRGLVAGYVVDDDPEHQWADSFRTSRTSNEARQLLLYTMTGKLRRMLARKARNLGCNAVIGYHQSIEFEGEIGLVARGYGTAAIISKTAMLTAPDKSTDSTSGGATPTTTALTTTTTTTTDTPPSKSALAVSSPRSIEASAPSPGEPSPHTPIVISVTDSASSSYDSSPASKRDFAQLPPLLQLNSVPLLTVNSLEPGTVFSIGGIVASRIVKLLKGDLDSSQRSKWWAEARDEVRQNALAMGCTHVIGYTESVATNSEEQVCVISAIGTAVHVDSRSRSSYIAKSKDARSNSDLCCHACHAPYSDLEEMPFPARISKCRLCDKHKVPDFLLSTAEMPEELAVLGKGRLLQARTCRMKKHGTGDANAVVVSSNLPFIEYDLHSQILFKLSVMGMNAVFGLRYELTISDTMIVAVATGTAVHLQALHPPSKLSLKKGDKRSFPELSKRINDEYKHNSEVFAKLWKDHCDACGESTEGGDEEEKTTPKDKQRESGLSLSSSAFSTSSFSPRNTTDSSQPFVISVLDDVDGDTLKAIVDPKLPPTMTLSTTERVPGLPAPDSRSQLVVFSRQLRWKNVAAQNANEQLRHSLDSMLESLLYNLRSTEPRSISNIRPQFWFNNNELHVSLVAACSQLPSTTSTTTTPTKHSKRSKAVTSVPSDGSLSDKPRSVGILLSTLSDLPDHQILQYVGYLNIHLIRESFSLREEQGIEGFSNDLLVDAFYILRSHVAAMGANALLSFRLNLFHFNLTNKDQCYCIISITGDAVKYQ